MLELPADRNPGNRQLRAQSIIRLDERSEHPAGLALTHYPRCGSGTSFELVADGPGPTPNIAFGDASIRGIFECCKHQVARDGKCFRFAEPGVIRFRDDGQQRGVANVGFHRVGAEGIAHHAHAARAGESDRACEQSLLGEPQAAGHLPIAIEAGGPGKDCRTKDVCLRPQHRQPRAQHVGFVKAKRGITHAHAGDVRNRIVWAWPQSPNGNAEIAQPAAFHVPPNLHPLGPGRLWSCRLGQ
jgi:hypothetical protein